MQRDVDIFQSWWQFNPTGFEDPSHRVINKMLKKKSNNSIAGRIGIKSEIKHTLSKSYSLVSKW